MTDKELRRLGKGDLIDIIYQMKLNEENLTAELEDVKKQLSDKNIKIENAGSIAEAAISVNGVMEAAQKAADDYLNQIHSTNKDVEERCKKMLEDTNAECKRLREKTDKEIIMKWGLFQSKLKELLMVRKELMEFLK